MLLKTLFPGSCQYYCLPGSLPGTFLDLPGLRLFLHFCFPSFLSVSTVPVSTCLADTFLFPFPPHCWGKTALRDHESGQKRASKQKTVNQKPSGLPSWFLPGSSWIAVLLAVTFLLPVSLPGTFLDLAGLWHFSKNVFLVRFPSR